MNSKMPPPFSSDTTTFAAVGRHAATAPEQLAVISGGRTLTYGELADAVSVVAKTLLLQEVLPGQRVAIETNNSLDHLVGALAVMCAGGVAVALSTDLTSYNAVLKDCDPVLIVATGDGQTNADAKERDIPVLRVGDMLAGTDVADRSLLEREVKADEIAMLYYTSGTSSGARKGVMQSYLQLHNTVHYITSIMRMDRTIREYVASPVDNAFWFGRCRCLFHVGGTAMLSSGALNPLSIISSLNRHAGNAIAGDTAVFMLLLHHMEKYLVQVGPSLRWIKIASAPMPIEDKKRLMQLLPNAWIVMNYGLTEAMRTCLHPFRESPEKLASVGKPCPSVELRIDGSDGQTTVQPHESGEVLIRGGNLASGYWNKEELWTSRYRDGWYHSGDIGYFDADGFLYLRGRIDHAINSGGKTIALPEVEEILRKYITKTSFAVCGTRDPKNVLGDVVALCVEREWKEELPWGKLRIRLFEAMEQLLVPVSAYVLPELPRTANGKVQLNNLRSRIETERYPSL
jgi:long-chain acyl-CoA synthetase